LERGKRREGEGFGEKRDPSCGTRSKPFLPLFRSPKGGKERKKTKEGTKARVRISSIPFSFSRKEEKEKKREEKREGEKNRNCEDITCRALFSPYSRKERGEKKKKKKREKSKREEEKGKIRVSRKIPLTPQRGRRGKKNFFIIL